MQPLPIDPVLPELCQRVAAERVLVLEAPPGAGKTTRVPAALLDADIWPQGEIVVTEPRRLAARLSARRVAEERGSKLGGLVGYSVRFEDVSSSATRLRYVTLGVLLRRLGSDPELRGVAAVVLDEFHERRLDSDLCLSLLSRLRQRRPELGLIVMSATLDAAPVAEFLGAGRLTSEGRSYPVRIEHAPRPDDRPLELGVLSAVKSCVRAGPAGDVLVFLPGAAEIRKAETALGSFAQEADLLVLPLHGDLPIERQVRAVTPGERRKVVLSTNVAESSVTIDGVTSVVDSGLARVATLSPWTGVPKLSLEKISRASAAQRAGRAGRTRPGSVIRLYTKGDHDTRPEFDAPEITRMDLAELCLTLRASDIGHASELRWLTPPPAAGLAAAESLLALLGALNEGSGLTEIGRRLLALPLPPRLARVVIAGEQRGIAELACLAAALLAERDIRRRSRAGLGGAPAGYDQSGRSDVIELCDRFDEAEGMNFDGRRLAHAELDAQSVRAVERLRRRLLTQVNDRSSPPDGVEASERALERCLLSAFADRLAKRRRRGERDLVLYSGATAQLSEASVVHEAPLLLALDVEQRQGSGRSGTVVRLASAVEPEWLLDDFAQLLEATEQLVWNSDAERVESVSRIGFGSIALEESRNPAPASDEAARLLARQAELRGPAAYDVHALDGLLSRLVFAAAQLPQSGFDELAAASAGAALAEACQGLTSFAELARADLTALLRGRLRPEALALLEREVPERITLPGGRGLKVHYERDKPPWVESRLQDFFGMSDTPRVARRQVPLTLHLLAPNQRAVQVTSDLAGFWERHYPKIRRELMRRYPKHSWPEDGRNAAPPARGRR